MCSPEVAGIMQAGQGISSGVTNYSNAKVQQSQFKSQAAVEEANVKIIEGQAKQVDYNAQLLENKLRTDSENLRSAQITAMGASGISLDSPSFQNILNTTDTYEAIDISLLRQSAGYEKASLLEQANQKKQLSYSYSRTARRIGKNARTGILIDTINTGANVSTSYLSNKALYDKYNLNKTKKG